MIEVEVKARIEPSEIADIERGIMEIGGVPAGEGWQEDIYFRHPCRDFADSDEALRLRRERRRGRGRGRGRGGGNAILTYKGRRLKAEVKAREEREVMVSDFDGARAILEGVGFTEGATVRKRRRKFILGEGMTVSLDSVEGLGEFVEVEVEVEARPGSGAESHGAIREEVSSKVLAIAERLGLPRERLTTEPYLVLLSRISSSRASR